METKVRNNSFINTKIKEKNEDLKTRLANMHRIISPDDIRKLSRDLKKK